MSVRDSLWLFGDLKPKNIRQANSTFLIMDWREGDSERPNLQFTATPGLTDMAKLPDDPKLTDFFNLFF